MVFAGLTIVTDRPTDRATPSVAMGSIYVRSTAMQPKSTGVANRGRRQDHAAVS